VEAAAKGDVEAVKGLLGQGVAVDAAPLDSKESWNALLWASENGHAEVVEALLEAGADPAATADRRQSTALHRAAFKGHAAAVEALLKAGAPADALESPGYAPLHRAAFKGRTNAVRALLAAGADPSLRVVSADAYKGCTAAELAEQRRHVSVAKMLRDAQQVGGGCGPCPASGLPPNVPRWRSGKGCLYPRRSWPGRGDAINALHFARDRAGVLLC
jgi:ankyrin repeat protein